MNRFRFKGCVKCQGDLVLDDGDWLCLQCGAYYYTGLYRKHGLTRQPQQPATPPRPEKTLRLDHAAADSLANQEMPSLLVQQHESPLAANLNASAEYQSTVRHPTALNC